MKETGVVITLMVKGKSGMLMVMFMKDRGSMIKLKVMVLIYIQMEQDTKVNGKMTELLHLVQARRTVAVAEAIAARDAAN